MTDPGRNHQQFDLEALEQVRRVPCSSSTADAAQTSRLAPEPRTEAFALSVPTERTAQILGNFSNDLIPKTLEGDPPCRDMNPAQLSRTREFFPSKPTTR